MAVFTSQYGGRLDRSRNEMAQAPIGLLFMEVTVVSLKSCESLGCAVVLLAAPASAVRGSLVSVVLRDSSSIFLIHQVG